MQKEADLPAMLSIVDVCFSCALQNRSVGVL